MSLSHSGGFRHHSPSTGEKYIATFEDVEEFGTARMGERPSAATGKEAPLVGEVGDPAIFRDAMEGNDSLLARVLKKMFEDGFV